MPIPILNEELAYFTGIPDRDIFCQVIDYGIDYPKGAPKSLCEVSYAELKTGRVEVMGKKIPAAPLSSYPMARRIAGILKEWIAGRGFTLGVPQLGLPTVAHSLKVE